MLNKRSLDNLEGVHVDLRAVVIRADKYTETPFLVIEGVRTLARQKALFAAGASKTMRSRHLTGHAIDFVPLISNKIEWKSLAFREPLIAFAKAAKELKIDVEFGADWKTFKDFPHVQLSWKAYP